MSLHATVWALKHADVGDAVAKLVLIGLADHARDDGTAAFPSQALLADYAETTTRTVRTKLVYLEELGLIRRGDQQLVDHIPGNRRPIVWDLGYATTPAAPEPPVRAEESSAHRGEDSSALNPPRPEAPRHPGRKLSSYKPSLEPSMETQGGISPSASERPPTTDEDKTTPQAELGGQRRDPDAIRYRNDRCANHQHTDAPPPCGACKDARLAAEQAALDQIHADRQRQLDEDAATRAAIRAAINHCPMCDDRGYRGRSLCNHDPTHAARTAQGAASARHQLHPPRENHEPAD